MKNLIIFTLFTLFFCSCTEEIKTKETNLITRSEIVDNYTYIYGYKLIPENPVPTVDENGTSVTVQIKQDIKGNVNIFPDHITFDYMDVSYSVDKVVSEYSKEYYYFLWMEDPINKSAIKISYNKYGTPRFWIYLKVNDTKVYEGVMQ